MDTLLIIDDTPDNIEILLDLLSKRDFKVLAANNGEDGIKTADARHGWV